MKITINSLSQRRFFGWRLLALLLIVTLLAACGGSTQNASIQDESDRGGDAPAASNVIIGDGEESPFNGTFLENDNPAMPIVAEDEEGQPFDMSELQGEYVLVNFGYTSCPAICPVTLANLMLAYNELTEAQQEEVNVVFVSVDPSRDTPERLNSYLASFSEDFIGLYIPEEETLETVKAAYGVSAEVIEPLSDEEMTTENYDLAHSGGVYVIDPEGTFKLFLAHDAPADAIRSDLLTLMEG